MYRVMRTLEISAAHRLALPGDSPCGRMHGHNWRIEVICEAEQLDERGMVVDFMEIERVVRQYDHACLNDFLEQPTAENLARAICEAVPHCVEVRAQEAEGCVACYTR